MITNSVIILDRRLCNKGHRHKRLRLFPWECKQSINESYSIPQRTVVYTKSVVADTEYVDYFILPDQGRFLYLDTKRANEYFATLDLEPRDKFHVTYYHFPCTPKATFRSQNFADFYQLDVFVPVRGDVSFYPPIQWESSDSESYSDSESDCYSGSE